MIINYPEMERWFPDTLFFGYSKAQMQKLFFYVQTQCTVLCYHIIQGWVVLYEMRSSAVSYNIL